MNCAEKIFGLNNLLQFIHQVTIEIRSRKSLAQERFKGIYLSKALTCMKIFLYKQELLFCQGDGYLWPHCCMNNLYILHRSLCAPTYSFWAIGSMLIRLFRVTSWFNTVNNAVTHWMHFRENHLHEHDLQLFDYNVKKYFDPKIMYFWYYLQFFNLTLKNS